MSCMIEYVAAVAKIRAHTTRKDRTGDVGQIVTSIVRNSIYAAGQPE